MATLTRIELYKVDSKGTIRIWSVEPSPEGLLIRHGVDGGSIQYKEEPVSAGKQGRSREQQIASRMQSRVAIQLDRGYKKTREEAKKLRQTNTFGYALPMLAHPIQKVKGIDLTTAFLQQKFDGHRCLVTCHNGKLVAYSREGKLIESVQHILDGIVLPNGLTIDGELYAHGHSLQTLSSWIKRKQERSELLKFYVYDIIQDVPYSQRLENLNNLELGQHAFVVPTERVGSEIQIQKHFNSSKARGYEGSMLRWGNAGYEQGKRSKSLVKIKRAFDEEFKVLDIEISKDELPVLICATRNNKIFKVLAPGTMEEKRSVMDSMDKYKGLQVTVEYYSLTESGVPFHPVAIRFHETI